MCFLGDRGRGERGASRVIAQIVTATWPTAKSGCISPLTTGNLSEDGDVM